ncbi:MAG: 1-acyl-sn-glycerol-3-phosphate acyltransferase [Alphaproteobacteria bacterium]|nr:1-acyl-sn-glycerol-3-phosphate acyltransferase [Alphaproteobacteria bacterium]
MGVFYTGDTQKLEYLDLSDIPNIPANERGQTPQGRAEMENYFDICMNDARKVMGDVSLLRRARFLTQHFSFVAAHAPMLAKLRFDLSKNPLADGSLLHDEMLSKLGVAVRFYGVPANKERDGVTAYIAPNHLGYFDGPMIGAAANAYMGGAQFILDHWGFGPIAKALGMVGIPRKSDIESGRTVIEGIAPKKQTDPVTGKTVYVWTPEENELLRESVANSIAAVLERANIVVFPEGRQGPGHDVGFFQPGSLRALFDAEGRAIAGRVIQPVVIDIEKVEDEVIQPMYLGRGARGAFACYGWGGGYGDERHSHIYANVMPRRRDAQGNRVYIGVHFLKAIDPRLCESGTRDASAKTAANMVARVVRFGLQNPPRANQAIPQPLPFKTIDFSKQRFSGIKFPK